MEEKKVYLSSKYKLKAAGKELKRVNVGHVLSPIERMSKCCFKESAGKVCLIIKGKNIKINIKLDSAQTQTWNHITTVTPRVRRL